MTALEATPASQTLTVFTFLSVLETSTEDVDVMAPAKNAKNKN